ncbi:uncharacterized protein LOC131940600 [Physella acuta]|uniref:uncharacterized protein LOC131940600 n=1 Tax=Physella acuta TaxID=109671 RepID=UPI0027DAE183|nr:uncharacterized protein LOC131940600 [Physella acuta]
MAAINNETANTSGAENDIKNSSVSDFLFVPWRDIISAVKDTKPSGQQNSSVILHYTQNRANGTLRQTSLRIEELGEQDEKWIDLPTKWAPVFELAQISTTVIETERPKHASEIGETQDFSLYDGVVLVGGDGLYQEFLQGLTIQTQKKAGVNYPSPDTKFVPTPIPIGIIAAGSGNGISHWINGTTDFETSALNIVRGEQHRGQMFTVHSGDKFVCVSAMMLGYGVWSDLIVRAEELRWMKRARYAYVIIASFFKKKRVFKCELTYCVSKDKKNCVETDGDTAREPDEEWVTNTKSNNFCGVFCATLTTVPDGDKRVLSPFGTHIQLGIDTGYGQLAMLKNLFYVPPDETTSSTPAANLEFIPHVTAFKIKLLRDESEENLTQAQAQTREMEKVLNIDGEIVYVDNSEINVRLHSSYAALYGRDKVNISFWS